MRIEWSDDLDRWFARLEANVDAGDGVALKTYTTSPQRSICFADCQVLRTLTTAPRS
jgi:hypothetical protein